MAETTLEKVTCENCGLDIRKNTQFCYNCGKHFAEAAAESNDIEPVAMSDEARTALDDLAGRFKADEADSADRLAFAAAERKKARVAPKKPKEAVWEAIDGRPSIFFFVSSFLIFVIVAAVVFITVYWK